MEKQGNGNRDQTGDFKDVYAQCVTKRVTKLYIRYKEQCSAGLLIKLCSSPQTPPIMKLRCLATAIK